jgi:hypothetical protein
MAAQKILGFPHGIMYLLCLAFLLSFLLLFKLSILVSLLASWLFRHQMNRGSTSSYDMNKGREGSSQSSIFGCLRPGPLHLFMLFLSVVFFFYLIFP